MRQQDSNGVSPLPHALRLLSAEQSSAQEGGDWGVLSPGHPEDVAVTGPGLRPSLPFPSSVTLTNYSASLNQFLHLSNEDDTPTSEL